MLTALVIVFALVYLGMIVGSLPGLALDRTGIALLGAIALMALGIVPAQAAWDSIDVPTIALLFGMMVVSAQLRVAGFYAYATRALVRRADSPRVFLALVIALAGVLSAFLTNDIVCLALAPLLIDACVQRGLAPIPYLLALCCASNGGSAATLIGNPQNMLLGQALQMDFAAYALEACVPTVLGLCATWVVIVIAQRGRFEQPAAARVDVRPPAYDAWQSGKALATIACVVIAFTFTSWPREVVALAAAGFLLVSRRTRSREILRLVDGQLLVLFIGLFVVNHAFEEAGLLTQSLDALRGRGVDASEPGILFGLGIVLSNLVSNVPAVMLLLPAATHPFAGTVLALGCTLAGNLLLVGSIANLIVIDQAARHDVHIGWREHARIGVPVGLVTLAIAAVWLAVRI